MKDKVLQLKTEHPDWSYRKIAQAANCSYSAVRYYLSPACKSQNQSRFKQNRLNKKQFCIDMLGGKCIVCGYDKCVQALDFHHLDPNQKELNIGSGLRGSLEHIRDEIKKCVVLCCRCHRELHAGQITLDKSSSFK